MQKPDVPNAISFGALQALMTEAQSETEALPTKPQFDMDEFACLMDKLSSEVIDKSFDIEGFDPMVHKLIVLKLLVYIGEYLSRLGEQSDNPRLQQRYHQLVGRLEIAHEAVMQCPMHTRDFLVEIDDDLDGTSEKN